MKNKILKIMCMMNVMLFGFMGTAFADFDGISITDGQTDKAETIIEKLKEIIQPVSAILVFCAVVMVGFEIIMKRNKADERMESMSSLMWVGIGALILGLAGTLFSFFAGLGE